MAYTTSLQLLDLNYTNPLTRKLSYSAAHISDSTDAIPTVAASVASSSDDEDSSTEPNFLVPGSFQCAQLLRALAASEPKRFVEMVVGGRTPEVLRSLEECRDKWLRRAAVDKTDWASRLGEYARAPNGNLLRQISEEFHECARLYGSVIIAEKHLPNQLKSIPAADLGGLAGGQKFVVANIVFKFSQDPDMTGAGAFLYGGTRPDHDAAHKAAGHELKGIDWIARRAGDLLQVPLMTLVDYRGERLSAQSLAPIDSRSLVYGSADAGATIVTATQFPHHKRAISEAASRFNLAPHRVCDAQGVEHVICLPVDIEIHQSTRDADVLVCLDTARLMPPLPILSGDGAKPQDIWVKLFRPEFISRYPNGALSSDTFSLFGRLDASVHNSNSQKAAEYLFTQIIPQLALEISEKKPRHLTKFMQERGVNARFLGVLRTSIQGAEGKRLALLEMIARCATKHLRRVWRMSVNNPALEAVKVVNQMRDRFREPQWLRDELRDKYGQLHIPDACDELGQHEALNRMLDLCGVRISDERLSSDDPISLSDLHLEPRLKILKVSSMARADDLYFEAKAKGASRERRKMLIQRARSLLETDLISDPSNVILMLRLARTEMLILKEDISQEDFDLARGRVESALSRVPARSTDGLWLKTKLALSCISQAVREKNAGFACDKWIEGRLLCEMLLASSPRDSVLVPSAAMAGKVTSLRDELCQKYATGIWDSILTPNDYEQVARMGPYLSETAFFQIFQGLAITDARTPKYFWLAARVSRDIPEIEGALRLWLTDRVVESFAPHLLTHSAVDDTILSQLTRFFSPETVTTVHLYHLVVTDALALSRFPLRQIVVEGCNFLKVEAVVSLMNACPNLQVVQLQNCAGLQSGDFFGRLPQSLLELSIIDCPRLELPEGSVLPPTLHTLVIRLCPSIEFSGDFLSRLPKTLRHLEGDDVKSEAANHLPPLLLTLRLSSGLCGTELNLCELRALRLGTCVSDEGLLALCKTSTKIELLDLKNCIHLSNPSGALKLLPHLKILHLDGSVNLSTQAIVDALLHSRARLSDLSLSGVWGVSPLDALQVVDIATLSNLSVDFPPPQHFFENLSDATLLTKLSLFDCPQFSAASWECFCRIVAPRLVSLNLEQCRWLHDEDMGILLENSRKFEDLRLDGLPLVSGTCLRKSDFAAMRKLVFISCCHDEGALDAALRRAPLLEHLELRSAGACDQVAKTLVQACPRLRHLHVSKSEIRANTSLTEKEAWIARLSLFSLVLGFPRELSARIVPKLKYAQLNRLECCLLDSESVMNLAALPSLSTLLQIPTQSVAIEAFTAFLNANLPISRLQITPPRGLQEETLRQRKSECLVRVSLGGWSGIGPSAYQTPKDFLPVESGLDSFRGWSRVVQMLQSNSTAILNESIVECYRRMVRPLDSVTKFAFLPWWGDAWSLRLLATLLQEGHHVVCATCDIAMTPAARTLAESLQSIKGLHFVARDLEKPFAMRDQIAALVPRLDTVITFMPGLKDPNLRTSNGTLVLLGGKLHEEFGDRIGYVMEQLVVPQMTALGALKDLIAKSDAARVAFPWNAVGSLSETSATFFPYVRIGLAAVSMLMRLWSMMLPNCIIVGVHFGPMVPGLVDSMGVVAPHLTRQEEEAAGLLSVMLGKVGKEHSGRGIVYPSTIIPF